MVVVVVMMMVVMVIIVCLLVCLFASTDQAVGYVKNNKRLEDISATPQKN